MKARTLIALWLMTTGITALAVTERLVLIGGGTRPPEALARFVEWSKGREAALLVIRWAWADGKDPGENPSVDEELEALGPKSIEAAVDSKQLPAKKADLLRQIKRATGIFFEGGQQHRIMEVLKDTEILSALVARYREGVVFSGTSAGTAIMSRTMITGDGDFTVIHPEAVVTMDGLGLLEHLVVDQHFLKRQRLNRLMSVLSRGKESLGVGIDESTALSIENNRYAQVVGPGLVTVVEAQARDQFRVELLHPGQKFDLQLRRRQ